jgi:ent-kaurene oxidase
VQRAAVKSYTFKDGFQVPRNTHMAFPNYELNQDPDIYDGAAEFRPWRFRDMRNQRDDPNKHHFTYVSHESINFGAGTHACPGRFFASAEIKLSLIYILTHYEIRWPKGQSRPPNMTHDFANSPDPMADVLFRQK